MEPSLHRYDWRGLLRRWTFHSALSAIAGIGITFLISLGEVGGFGWHEALAGVVIGVVINTTILFLEVLLVPLLEARTSASPLLLRVPIYVLGGVLGFLLAQIIVNSVLPGSMLIPAAALRVLLIFIGAFSLVMGLLIYGFEMLRDRLRESVEQLKEQEFAAKELELARSIQKRLLPPVDLDGDNFAIAAKNLAARWVAGDFFDVFRLDNGDLGLVVADVAGKGMGASLIMASSKAMLPFIAAQESVAETLSKLNARLSEDLGPREFVALAFARFSPATGTFELGNAGLPDPFLISGDEISSLEVPGPRLPLGARARTSYQSATWTLGPCDRLLMFTDGLPEAFDESGSPLGYERLEELLPRESLTARAWLDRLFEALPTPSDGGLEDDWTAMVLERKAVP